MTDIIVIGGGAAGMMAALTAAQGGASVALLECNPKLGRKLYITGKSPTMVADYTLHLPDKRLLQNKLRELTELAMEIGENEE